ncbi:hypothetical protein GCM10022225_41390 [Plantactinospora mayteni]|uniref:Uncharacterized protein n=1 Tax=Plantactinospora mayteni TaxID=566021 RepID=A0ABQ4EU27_9ACTN|nr:hypothetical protein Pma05_47360 [Plantactinospora mayteni]
MYLPPTRSARFICASAGLSGTIGYQAGFTTRFTFFNLNRNGVQAPPVRPPNESFNTLNWALISDTGMSPSARVRRSLITWNTTSTVIPSLSGTPSGATPTRSAYAESTARSNSAASAEVSSFGSVLYGAPGLALAFGAAAFG